MKSYLNLFVLAIFSVFALSNCGTDAKKTNPAPVPYDPYAPKKMSDLPKELRSEPLPADQRVNNVSVEKMDGEIKDPCSLLSREFIQRTLGVTAGINLKEGNKFEPGGTTRSCFFKWDDANHANSGIMIQVLKNPMPDEYDDYITFLVDSKKSSGEKSMDHPDKPDLFYPYNDLGDAGAMSFESKKFYWRISNKMVFMLAYNLPASDLELKNWTRILGTELMRNYNL